MSTSTTSRPTLSDTLASVSELLPEISENGRLADSERRDPAENMSLLASTGLQRVYLPKRFGGLWEERRWAGVIDAITLVSAGDGPTGQNWGTTAAASMSLFDPYTELPESTLTAIADRVLEGLRICESNAETGVSGRTTARRVDGGVIVSGTKSFNTNSGGRGLANVGVAFEDFPRYHALVDLSDANVEFHDDWDNMGQRGTWSQTITYHDVFVADGWHFPSPASPVRRTHAVLLLHAGLMQGIGEGALVATTEFMHTLTRGSLPGRFAHPGEDPLMLRRIGDIATRLAASRALLRASAEGVAEIDRTGDGDFAEVQLRATESKIASVEAALFAAQELFELTGARSTTNRYGLDRFWRNARTFASHDPIDAKYVWVGEYTYAGGIESSESRFFAEPQH